MKNRQLELTNMKFQMIHMNFKILTRYKSLEIEVNKINQVKIQACLTILMKLLDKHLWNKILEITTQSNKHHLLNLNLSTRHRYEMTKIHLIKKQGVFYSIQNTSRQLKLTIPLTKKNINKTQFSLHQIMRRFQSIILCPILREKSDLTSQLKHRKTSRST